LDTTSLIDLSSFQLPVPTEGVSATTPCGNEVKEVDVASELLVIDCSSVIFLVKAIAYFRIFTIGFLYMKICRKTVHNLKTQT